ncbi:hypothetical protein BC828DRAFT_404119 [Blastocladiella britannica]|nr:hypothetical protein BC828DRAFT_404119 [Blastocladiella britannica]
MQFQIPTLLLVLALLGGSVNGNGRVPKPTPTPTRTTTTSTTVVPTSTSTRPVTSTAITTSVVVPTKTTTSSSSTATPTSTLPVADVCGGKLRQRKAFSTLSDAEKKAFAAGVMAMKKSGKWDQYTLKHRSGMQWHMTTQFLLMHRALLTDFETELLKNAPGLSGLPFWDEFSDSANPLKSTAFSTSGLGPMASGPLGAPFTGLTDDSGDLVARDPDTSGSGKFNWVPQPQVMAAALSSYKTFGEMSHAIELTPHNSYHMLVGGHMGDPSISPADPLFYLHHAYIDTLWAGWQGSNPLHVTDLTVPGRARGDIQINPAAGTVLYEKTYTNTDMVYYRQRLCYEYVFPASLSGAQRAQRAMRALKDLDASSTVSANVTVTATNATSTNATTAAATNSSSTSNSNSTGPFLAVDPLPLAALHRMMPHMDAAVIAQRVSDAVASLNAAAQHLNDQVEAAMIASAVPVSVAVAQVETMHDLQVEAHAFIATQVQDDFKDSGIAAVQAMSVESTAASAAGSAGLPTLPPSSSGSSAPSSFGSSVSGFTAAAIAAAALAGMAM